MDTCKREKRKKHYPIRKQLTNSYLILIIILIALSAFFYLFAIDMNHEMTDLLNQQATFNTFFVVLKDTKTNFENYLVSGDPYWLDLYRQSEKELTEDAELLVDFYYTRPFVDNEIIADTYVENIEKAIELKQANNGEYYTYSQEANYIKELIERQYSRLYEIIATSTEEEMLIIHAQMQKFNLLGTLILISGGLSFLFTKRFSNKIVTPIQALADVAKRVADGDLTMGKVEYASSDEISILIKSFNDMICTIRKQITQLEEKAIIEQNLQEEKLKYLWSQKLLKESELKALQSRINPHFLFNSLNIISQMAYMEEAGHTMQMIAALSNILRYSLHNINRIVTIRDEIEAVTDYIYIQKQRFGDRIEFKIDYDPLCEDVNIPSLILQPLIENAVMHGVASYAAGGMVGVDIQMVGEKVRIKIYDNGLGMDGNTIDSLMEKLNRAEEPDDNDGIGLVNVYSRLKIFYHDDVAIHFTSLPGEYTEVRVDIPSNA